MAHPASPQARHGSALPLHLPVEEGIAFGDGSGADADPQSTQPDAVRPAAPSQPGAAGVGELLQARRVEADLQLPRPVRLAAGSGLAAQTTPGHLVGTTESTLPPRMAT